MIFDLLVILLVVVDLCVSLFHPLNLVLLYNSGPVFFDAIPFSPCQMPMYF